MTQKRLFLIDGSAFIFRSYHALPPLSRSDGTPVGAVSGVCNMFFKLREEIKQSGSATHIAVIFDAGSKTFRNDIYSEYKAHRPPAPEDLIPQFSLCRKAAEAFNMASIEMAGYEADDIIATYAKQATQNGFEVVIYSSDKDLMQLVNDTVSMMDPIKNKEIGPQGVFEKFGVYPDKVTHVQALAGDSSDNIPGIPGIGVKTAAQLINEYGTLENLLERSSEIKQNKRRENLIEFADKARISYELVCLKLDMTGLPPLDDLALRDLNIEKSIDFLKQMELNSLTKRVAARLNHVIPLDQGDLFSNMAQQASAVKTELTSANYKMITDIKTLEAYLRIVKHKAIIACDTETTSLNIISADLVGISLSHNAGEGVYIPLGHKTGEQITITDAVRLLKPILESEGILKIGHNIKYDASILKKYDIDISPYDDTMLLSSCLYGGKHRHNMNDLAKLYLDHDTIPYEEICGKGKNQITFDHVPIQKATNYAAEDADITLRLWHIFKPDLIRAHKTNFYEKIERPIAKIVAKMEQEGIKIDPKALQILSDKFTLEMQDLSRQIFTLSDCDFNIASPKQLGEVLFTKMQIPHPAKKKTTASGQMSTSSDVLEKLAENDYPIADHILRWRMLHKLKSTYADALMDHIHPKTKRVHTAFHLTGAATGRFSSSDPNLQNIPIRTEEGRLIRQAFIPKPGHLFVSADYSQVELRILSHIADIPSLKEAFKNGEDIHAKTASEVFSTPLKDVDTTLRRKAKAVNFGIIYGISAFGLGRQLNISAGEAKEYIDLYFSYFPQIKDYMEQTKEQARKNGYIETIFGRLIHTKDINIRNFMQRSLAERAAINAPIQGAAADIIKCAMIQANDFIQTDYPQVKMLLQIHDELVFEVPKDLKDEFTGKIKSLMEQAPFKIMPHISCPILKVDVQSGQNWNEAH